MTVAYHSYVLKIYNVTDHSKTVVCSSMDLIPFTVYRCHHLYFTTVCSSDILTFTANENYTKRRNSRIFGGSRNLHEHADLTYLRCYRCYLGY